LAGIGFGAVVILMCGAIYAVVFSRSVGQLGGRTAPEISEYSARLINLLAAPPMNRLYGNLTAAFWAPERALFPGVIIMLLAAVVLAGLRHRTRLLYIALAAFAVLMSLGFNSQVYQAAYGLLPPMRNLRAPARFGTLWVLAYSVLAAHGLQILLANLSRAALRAALVAACIIGLAVESASEPRLMTVRRTSPQVYRVLSTFPVGPTIELPMPDPGALPGVDPEYEYFSIFHWFPMVNGYSGYYPQSYLRILEMLQSPTDTKWLSELEDLRVKYALVHLGAPTSDLLRRAFDESAQWIAVGSYTGSIDVVLLFRARTAGDAERGTPR
jgi:hypothetical protein